MKEQKPLNLRAVFASKSPSIAKRIPDWLINFLSRVIHINDLNYLLNTYKDLDPVKFAEKTIEYTGATYKVSGSENIPAERCIFVSNHPLGGLDGLILIHSLSKYCKNGVKLIVNDLLMNLQPLRPVFIPVNKHGRQSVEYSNLMEDSFNSNCQIVTFPAGLCSRLIDGEIKDTAWKKNFATKAISTNRVIVPVYFEGRNSMKFYRIAKIRKALHIKFNVEMLLLPHEMFCPTTKQITIHIGKPIIPEQGTNIPQLIEQTRNAVYSMRNKDLLQ